VRIKIIRQIDCSDEKYFSEFEDKVNQFLSTLQDTQIYKIEHFYPEYWHTCVIYYEDKIMTKQEMLLAKKSAKLLKDWFIKKTIELDEKMLKEEMNEIKPSCSICKYSCSGNTCHRRAPIGIMTEYSKNYPVAQFPSFFDGGSWCGDFEPTLYEIEKRLSKE
jgi:hypothetical protein